MIKSIILLVVSVSFAFSGLALADNHEIKAQAKVQEAVEQSMEANPILVPGQPTVVEPSKLEKMTEKEAYWQKRHAEAMEKYNALSFEDKKKYSLKRIAAMQRKLESSKACVELAQTEEALKKCHKHPKRAKKAELTKPANPAKTQN